MFDESRAYMTPDERAQNPEPMFLIVRALDRGLTERNIATPEEIRKAEETTSKIYNFISLPLVLWWPISKLSRFLVGKTMSNVPKGVLEALVLLAAYASPLWAFLLWEPVIKPFWKENVSIITKI